MTIDWTPPPRQGWQCPFCKTVYSPVYPSCGCQTHTQQQYGTGTQPVCARCKQAVGVNGHVCVAVSNG